MADLQLTIEDYQEMLSSLLLAELPYTARMQYTEGPSLPPSFVPTLDILPSRAEIADRVSTVFHAPSPEDLDQCTLRQWATALHTGARTGELTFFTSGSTGEPTPATHPITNHEQEVTALASVFQGRTRVVSFVPRHHIYGFLFSILLPKAMGVDVQWVAPLPTPGVISNLCRGDLVVAFPLFWNKLKDMNIEFGDGLQGVTSTGPCPAQTIEALKANGLDRMYEIYGSSETGGVGYRSTPDSGYTLLPHWSRSDDDSRLTRRDAGEGDCPYLLQDVLHWHDATTFTPTRRTDNAVQVAGINVYPSRVREILLEHPSIADCAVRLMRTDEGSRLKTLIVPARNDHDVSHLRSSIQQWARDRLNPYELPMKWDFKRKIPTNALGKIQDW